MALSQKGSLQQWIVQRGAIKIANEGRTAGASHAKPKPGHAGKRERQSMPQALARLSTLAGVAERGRFGKS
jgi:hypothetical protein